MKKTLCALYRLFVPQRQPGEIKRKYGIPDQLDWEIELTNDGWFVAQCKQQTGIMTQARSKKELLAMMNDAVLTYYGVPWRESDFVFNKLRLADEVICYEAQTQTA
jgi:predicted RNase H-like HicB family nuclease